MINTEITTRGIMFTQADCIRDYVFPIVTVNTENQSIEHFYGTGFVIGNKGYALTAGHVVAEHKNKELYALFVYNNQWIGISIRDFEVHPDEDVAILKLDHSTLKSWFVLESQNDFASCKYGLWGYPDEVAREVVLNSRVMTNPELIYNEGYIRRRVSHNFDYYKGNSFFELSQVAGSGASGAPVYKGRPGDTWLVIGIYIGERVNDRSTSVSYAVRVDSFRDWVPNILGTSLFNEAEFGVA